MQKHSPYTIAPTSAVGFTSCKVRTQSRVHFILREPKHPYDKSKLTSFYIIPCFRLFVNTVLTISPRLILPAPQHDIRDRFGVDVIGILEHMGIIIGRCADTAVSKAMTYAHRVNVVVAEN